MTGIYETLPDTSVDRFISVLLPAHGAIPDEEVRADPLLAACRYVAKAAKVQLTLKTYQREGALFERLNQLAEDSQFRIRQVGLTGAWWKVDHGSLLVFRKSDDQPCALVPLKAGKYQLIDPALGGKGRVFTQALVAELHNFAYFFYRPLPEDVLTWKNILKFAFENLGHDIYRLLAMQIVMGLLGLLIPIATGVIFDRVIPNANPNLLMQFLAALLVTTFASIMFEATQSIAMMRIRYRLNGILQPALWDRLLRLPVGFFRYFSAGNLADRAHGIDAIQHQLTGAVISAVLGGIFSVITLVLMFYYDYVLALYALGVALFLALFSLGANLVQLNYQRHAYQINGIVSGLLLQLFLSISKLRIANREAAAFQLWASHFADKTIWIRKAGFLQIGLSVFGVIINTISIAMLYLIVVKRANVLSFGSFIAFNAAYGQFFSAIFAMSGAISSSLAVIPLYERAQPILKQLPEANKTGIALQVTGNIRIQHVAFRYPLIKPLDTSNEIKPESSTPGPWVFRDLGLEIAAGQFVALVGPSGAGKSTIFRLLLGFEKAEKGMITFDNYDLATINYHHLRRQVGVVLQNSILLPGTIIDNLRSTNPLLTLEQALEILAQVQFEEDLAAMPMGLFTLIAEGGINLSAGQRQRLLIAKAVAHRPQLIFLDEATSALDNHTQSIVYQYVRDLKVTRIVAAHRLSTIQNADVIYVINEGTVAQKGTFEDLMLQSEGLFAKLVKRQQL